MESLIEGTPENDYELNGTEGADTLIGLAGNDFFYPGAGDDSIEGGPGNDFAQLGYASPGTGGNDTFDGGDGFDAVGYGFDGEPVHFVSTLMSGVQLDGRGGQDTLVSVEQLLVFGTAGNDTITGGEEDNFFTGEAGNDLMTGGGGMNIFDYFMPNAMGNDTITDFGAGDVLNFWSPNGFAVTRLALYSPEAEIPSLAKGEIALVHRSDHTTLIVGTGNAFEPMGSIRLEGTFSPLYFSIAAQESPYFSRIVYVPGLIVGTPGDDQGLNGTQASDTILGLSGDDTINGHEGNDSIEGSAGNDFMHGGEGNDTIAGADGNDWFRGGPGNDLLLGGSGSDYFHAGGPQDTGDDTVSGGEGDDGIIFAMDAINGAASPVVFTSTLSSGIQQSPLGGTVTLISIERLDIGGSDSADVLTGADEPNAIWGNAGDDVINGGAGSDRLHGGRGNDVVSGGADNDFVEGEAGDDIVVGGAGADTLKGGEGADRFVFTTLQDSGVQSPDIIADFFSFNSATGGPKGKSSERDILDLSAIDANALRAGQQQFRLMPKGFTGNAGELIVTYDQPNNRTLVQLDVNGDKVADFVVALVGQVDLLPVDFGIGGGP